MVDKYQGDNFFNIYVFYNSTIFNIFYHIDIQAYLHYIWSFFDFFHIDN